MHIDTPFLRRPGSPGTLSGGQRCRCAVCFIIAMFLAAAGPFSEPALAGVTEAWVHRSSNVASNRTAEAVKAVINSDGDVIVIGNIPESGFVAIIKYSSANGSVSWQQRYRSAGPFKFDRLKDVGLDGNNSLYVLGRSYQGEGGPSDYFTLKLADTDGAILWEKRHPGTVANQYFEHALAVDDTGNVLVTVPSDSAVGGVDACTIKYSAADGVILWEKCYDGPANSDDIPRAIAVDGNGHVVVTTQSLGGPPNYKREYHTAQYAIANGELLWEQRHKGPAEQDDYVEALAVTKDGSVVVTGSSGTIKYSANGTGVWTNTVLEGAAITVDGDGNVLIIGEFYDGVSRDHRLMKCAAKDGSVLWERHPTGRVNDVAVDSENNVVVTGAGVSAEGSHAYFTAKYRTTDGEVMWENLNEPSEEFYAAALVVAVDFSGDVVVTGVASNVNGEEGTTGIATVKYTGGGGTLLWDARYAGWVVSAIFPQASAVDSDGNVVVTGAVSERGHTSCYTAKYAAADGSLLWEQRYKNITSGFDFPTAVGVDTIGNVLVTGQTTGTGGRGIYTVKYAATDGGLLWEKRYNGPANIFDTANALAVDGVGNVVVTGYSNNGTNDQICTLKYAASDGVLLWERRQLGRGYAVAVDGQNDVVITGDSMHEGNPVGYTAKYAAADGAPLWEQRNTGLLGGDSEVRTVSVDRSGDIIVSGSFYLIKYSARGAAVWSNTIVSVRSHAVDSRGNIVVTGGSYANNGNANYYTAKYASTDGSRLWERYYNGPADGDDFVGAVAVDVSDDVVVTGTSSNGTNTDYCTVKYAGADGALLWEKHYNGPVNGDDWPSFAHTFASGAQSMVAIIGTSFNVDGHTDIATIVYRENPLVVSIALVPSGVRLRFTGTPGQGYRIESAPTVTGPWATVATLIAPAEARIDYLVSNMPAGSVFYRLRCD